MVGVEGWDGLPIADLDETLSDLLNGGVVLGDGGLDSLEAGGEPVLLFVGEGFCVI